MKKNGPMDPAEKTGRISRCFWLPLIALLLSVSMVFLPQQTCAGQTVSIEAVEAFAARAEAATTASAGLSGEGTGEYFVNWCFNGVPDLVTALGRQANGPYAGDLISGLLKKGLGTFNWVCTGSICSNDDDALWNAYVGHSFPADRVIRVSDYTPFRGDIVLFHNNESSATALSQVGILTSAVNWKYSSGGIVFPNRQYPADGFDVKVSFHNNQYNWREYIVGFFHFSTPIPEMENAEIDENGVLQRYYGSDPYVEIPLGITGIGKYAFSGNTGLTGITIPKTVQFIEQGAFLECTGLTEVTIPNSVTEIRDSAFRKSGLTRITIPNSVAVIGASAFQECPNLVSVSLPSGLRSIGKYAFSECTGLQDMTIPDSVNSLGACAFSKCTGLKSLKFPANLTAVPDQVCSGCSSLTDVTIPNTVRSIGYWSFGKCESLKTLTLPSQLVSLGESAFAYCSSLEDLQLPSGLSSIGNMAFQYCTSLTSLQIPAGVTALTGIHIFIQCTNLTDIFIPASVTEIGPSTGLERYTTIHTTRGSWADAWGSMNRYKVVYDDEPEIPGFRILDHTGRDVTGLRVDLDMGGTTKYTFKAVKANGTSPKTTWSIDAADPKDVLTVKNGVITLKKPGTVNITASYKEGRNEISAKVGIRVISKVQPGSLKIKGTAKYTLQEGNTLNLGPKVQIQQKKAPQNPAIHWGLTDSQAGAAAVDPNTGVVRVIPGCDSETVGIWACSSDLPGECVEFHVTTIPLPKNIVIVDKENNTGRIDMAAKKKTYQLGVEIMPKGAKGTIQWSIEVTGNNSPKDLSKIAKVNQKGLVTAAGKMTGTVKVTAALKPAKKTDPVRISDSCEIEIVSLVQPGNLKIYPVGNYVTWPIGNNLSFIHEVKQKVFAQSVSVTWSSSDEDVAVIDQQGNMRGVGLGPVTITAMAKDGSVASASWNLTIVPKTESIRINNKPSGGIIEIVKGKKIQLGITIEPANAYQDVTWQSSNVTAAKVTGDGVVTGLQVGQTSDIIVWTNDGNSRRDMVTVKVVSKLSSPVGSSAEAESEAVLIREPDEPAAQAQEAEMIPAVQSEPEGQAQKTGAVFALNEVYLPVGESLAIDVMNPDEEDVVIGLGGETEAVLWNEEERVLTAVGEAEVTAFLAAADTVEIKDMMTIHIISRLPAAEEEISETAENEEVSEPLPAEEVTTAGEEPEETLDAIPEEPPAEEPAAETEGPAVDPEKTEPETADIEAEGTEEEKAEEPAAETPVTEPHSEPETEIETPEIIITGLDETAVLEGSETGVITIERERFEPDNELMKALVFEIEDETIAKLADRSADETAEQGIRLDLLAAGETKLIIRLTDDEAVLREIAIVVHAVPETTDPVQGAETAGEEEQPADDPVPPESPAGEEPPAVEPVPAEASGEEEQPAGEPETAEDPITEPVPDSAE